MFRFLFYRPQNGDAPSGGKQCDLGKQTHVLLGLVSDEEHGEQGAEPAADHRKPHEQLFGDAADGAARQFADGFVVDHHASGDQVDEGKITPESVGDVFCHSILGVCFRWS